MATAFTWPSIHDLGHVKHSKMRLAKAGGGSAATAPLCCAVLSFRITSNCPAQLNASRFHSPASCNTDWIDRLTVCTTTLLISNSTSLLQLNMATSMLRAPLGTCKATLRGRLITRGARQTSRTVTAQRAVCFKNDTPTATVSVTFNIQRKVRGRD
jgi:hypothetical protein